LNQLKSNKLKLGYVNSKETREKIRVALKGRTMSEVQKKKIKESSIKFWSQNTRKGHISWCKGKKMDDTVKLKVSISRRGKMVGYNHPNWKGGKPLCLYCGKKLSSYAYKCCVKCSPKLQSKEKHWNWQGGITKLPYPLGWTKTFKEQIRKRDGYKCQICGCSEVECLKTLCVHHIDYNKDNLNGDNLISLCRSCHIKTNRNRQAWTKRFILSNNVEEN